MNTPQALLSAGWALGGAAASESISVYTEGEVWYWRTLAADQESRNLAGTFRIEIEAEELTQLNELAERLGSEPDPGDAITPTALQVRITTMRPVARSFAFSWVRDRPPSRTLQLVWDALRGLAGRATASPVATLRLDWKAISVPGQPPTLMFVFENLGKQPIDVLIDPGAFTLTTASRGAGDELWRGSPHGTVGLVEGGGAPLGGILSPAVIGPGQTATAVFPNALSVAEPPIADVVAHAEGRLPLIKPGEPAPFPDTTFVLETLPSG
jgi:hypothetical protein